MESKAAAKKFLKKYKTVVVRPSEREYNTGVSLELESEKELEKAIRKAKKLSPEVLLEEYISGLHLRILVIGFEMVTAAIYHPPQICGTGKHTIKKLISKYNRRKLSATGGESKIPWDKETKDMIEKTGYKIGTILSVGENLVLRRNTSECTGGRVEFITESLPSRFKTVAEDAARELNVPVVSFDFLVPDLKKEKYYIIEANERPGLRLPIEAEKCIDFFFPETKS